MNRIDLHGTRHEGVTRKLDIFFWEMIQKNINSVEVVTGISDKMKELVRETCIDYDFSVTEHPTNVGCLIILLA